MRTTGAAAGPATPPIRTSAVPRAALAGGDEPAGGAEGGRPEDRDGTVRPGLSAAIKGPPDSEIESGVGPEAATSLERPERSATSLERPGRSSPPIIAAARLASDSPRTAPLRRTTPFRSTVTRSATPNTSASLGGAGRKSV